MIFHNLLRTGICTGMIMENGVPVRITEIPWSETLPRQTKRKIGRLTLMMYSAMYAAVQKLVLPEEFPLVVGTAYGEVDTGLEVLADLYETRGATLRPLKVQNSVHVSSAGHLGILFGNRGPTLTISQGKLTAEASLQALGSLMKLGDYPVGVMVIGDLFNPEWPEKLVGKAPEYSRLLTARPYMEGAAALVLGSPNAPMTPVGWETAGAVCRCPSGTDYWPRPFVRLLEGLPFPTPVFTRAFAPWSGDPPLPKEPAVLDLAGDDEPLSLTGPLLQLISNLGTRTEETLLYLSREDDEIGIIRCNRLP